MIMMFLVQNGFTALIMAVIQQHIDIVKAILNARPRPNPNIRENVWLISLANILYYKNSCNKLIFQTANWTALFYAAMTGNLQITKMLIEGGARVDILDEVSYIS